MLSLCTSKESEKQILSVRLCPWVYNFHSSLLTGPRSPEKLVVLAPGSWEWKAVCLERFADYYLTKGFKCGMPKDFNRLAEKEPEQSSITKEEQRQYFDSHIKKRTDTRFLTITKTPVFHILLFLATVLKNTVRSPFAQYHPFNK